MICNLSSVNGRGCGWLRSMIAAAVFSGATVTLQAQPVGKYGELADRYGNPSRALREMMATQSTAREQRSAPLYRVPAGESPFAEWARGLQAKAEAEANAQRAAQAKKENDKRRAEEERARDERLAIAADRRAKAAETAKAQARAEAAELHEQRFGAFIRTSQSFLQALRTGAPFPKERSETVADAMLVGAFQWKDGWNQKWTKFAELGITCTDAERYAVAMEIYKQRSTNEYEHWLAEAAYALNEKGWITIQVACEAEISISSDAAAAPSNWHWSGLVSALAQKQSRLNENQRQQATALLAEIIQGLPAAQDTDGLARACLLVAAARQTPALACLERLQSVFVPQVAGSVWAAGFTTMPVATAGGAAPVATNLGKAPWLELAEKLILSPGGYGSDYPGRWFSRIRELRRRGGLAAASGANQVFLQRALDGWLGRRGASPMLRRALQQEFDLTCTGDAAALKSPALMFWDHMLNNHGVKYVRERDRSMELLFGHDPARSGVVGFLLASGPQVMDAYISLACEGRVQSRRATGAKAVAAASPVAWKNDDPRWLTALSALQQLTDLPLVAGESLASLGVAKERWTELLKVGERAAAAGLRMWNEANTTARLVRVRREILGESREIAERQIYASNPMALTQRLSALNVAPLTPETRRVVKELLAYADDIVVPADVLTIAQLRGPLLGDWARLGDWLDDPRRRPKGKDDPLNPYFIVAVIERDQVAGRLTDNWFTSAKNAVACERFEKWLEQVLAAKGPERKKLIDENFPAVIYCEGAASAYPDLRMLGYDAARGGFASRALLLLSTAEFNPENLLMAGVSEIELNDGTVIRRSLYDVEPWLEAVAKLPRAVPAEALLAQLTAGVQSRLDWQAKVAALPRREVFPGLSKEENEKINRPKSPEEIALLDDERRSGWVGGGCQHALARLAERWSPVRESAQAAILARGDQLLLDQDDLLVHAPSIAARLKWEQSKMRGLDDAEAFAVASAGLSGKDLRIMAKLADAAGWLRPLVLWQDEGFVSEAKAASAAVAAR